jgi:hypothetical protein
MSERKINLEDIAEKVLNCTKPWDLRIDLAGGISFLDLKSICMAFGQELLELAVENMKSDALERFGSDIPDCWDEQSILNTIKQIE